jgi:hypothetical protein
MFSVVKLLRLEHALHLVGHCVVGIVAEIGRDLVSSGQDSRASPSRNIEDLLVRRLLCHLHRVDGAH